MSDADKRAKAAADLGYFPADVTDAGLAQAYEDQRLAIAAERRAEGSLTREQTERKFRHLYNNRREHG